MANNKSVFISYSSQDVKFVNYIVKLLEEEGVAYWKAPEMIPAGSSYAREIPRAIRECEVFLLILSATSQESIWVEKEIDSAISHRKNIIPLQIENVPLNDAFCFYLNNVQMISYASNPEHAIKELKEQLNVMVKDSSASVNRQRELKSNDSSVTVSDFTKMVHTKKNADKIEKIEKIKMELFSEKTPFPRRNYVKKSDSNALRINRIPLECDYCGSKMLENITMGTYRCTDCGQDSYDDFQTIRNYLEKVGHASATVIERDTGVPKRVIEYFFREEYLEIPKNSPVRVPCERCGAPIRTGSLCDDCKINNKGKTSNDRRGTWHSLY